MAGEFSSAGAGYALDIVTGRNAGPGARTTYVALLTAAPTDATTLATMPEVTTSGYARQAVTWSAPAGDPQETHNTAEVVFGPFNADPPNITHVALVSAAAGTVGDLAAWWALDTARDGISGDSVRFAVAALSLSCD